ncbi:DUF5131 family protein [Streptomyces aureus]|uniref:DUF5131 family protein n=1 Tax=Streptomyces aureus TaxID=193461 RepID=UPI0005610192|nr:phage Gp37/Gp68 family protein [Streptomyces aureus]
MATTSKIEWTDATWNIVTGCEKVSPGCDNCYAETFTERFRGTAGHHFETGFDLTLRPERLALPLRWRKPKRVFVNSMSDLFHKDIPDDYLTRAFAVMSLTPQHTYQVLTKRHGRMRSLLSSREFVAQVDTQREDIQPGCGDFTWPLPNVWLGVSVEDQKRADLRIPALLETPAAVRFLSCEPLLGPIDLCGPIVPGRGRPKLTYWLDGRPGWGPDQTDDRGRVFQEMAVGPRIDWVIVGGESGPKARAMHPGWARTIRDQCAHSGVPFFFKQWGEWGPAPFQVRVCDPEVGWLGTDEELVVAKADSEARGATHVHTGSWSDEDGERRYWLHEIGHKPWSLERCGLPNGMAAIRRWGKGRAGRELDGQVHDAFPIPAA